MFGLLRKMDNRASILSIINIFIKMILSLITVPLTIEVFGEEMYGIWAAALSIMTFVNFLDAGLTPSILNRLSITYSNKDKDGFKNAYCLGIYVGVIVILISIIGSMFISYIDLRAILKWSSNIDSNEVIILFKIVLITTGLIIGTSIFENVFFSAQMGDIPRIASITSNIIGLGIVVIISKLKASMIVLALAIQIPKFAYRLVLLLIITNKLNVKIFPLPKIENKYIKSLFNTSGLFIFIQIFQWLYSSSASFIIPKFIGLNEFSEFSIQFMPFNVILTIVASMQPIFWPKLLELYSKSEKENLTIKLKRVISISSILISIFIVGYMILGPIFIKIYSRDTVEFKYFISIILSLWLITQSIVWWYSTFLHGIEDLKFEILVFASSSLFLIIVSYLVREYLTLDIYVLLMWLSILMFNLLPMYLRVKNIIKEI